MKIAPESNEKKNPFDFLRELYRKRVAEFPITNKKILILITVLSVLIVLLTITLLILLYTKNGGFYFVYQFFNITTIGGTDVSDVPAIAQFNKDLFYLGETNSARIVAFIVLAVVLVIVGALAFYYKMFFLFFGVWILTVTFGIILIIFGLLLTSYNVDSGKVIFAGLLKDYSAKDDCWYTMRQFMSCIQRPEKRFTFSFRIASLMDMWKCCGYNGYAEFVLKPNYTIIPLFCCSIIGESMDKTCQAVKLNQPCSKVFRKGLTESYAYFTFVAFTISVGLLLLAIFGIVLYDSIMKYHVNYNKEKTVPKDVVEE